MQGERSRGIARKEGEEREKARERVRGNRREEQR